MRLLSYWFVLLVLGFAACAPLPPLPHVGPRPQVKSGGGGAVSGGGSVSIDIPKAGSGVVTPRKENRPSLEWLSPTAATPRIGLVAEKITVRVRVTAPQEVQLSQLEYLVDGAVPGSKADEVSLLKRAEFNDQIMTFQVPLPPGEHQVQVVLTLAGNERYLAERTFVRDAAGVRMLNRTPVTSATRVIWTKPDVFVLKDNEVFSTRQRELEVRFNITSPNNLRQDQVRILHNQVYRLPSPKAEFRGENGSYYFRDWITLDENVSINDIALRGDGVSSRRIYP